MRLLSSVALPRSALFAAVAATLLALPGTAGAQISSAGGISNPVGPGNTDITGTLTIGSGSAGSVTVENNSLLQTGTLIPGPDGQFTLFWAHQVPEVR